MVYELNNRQQQQQASVQQHQQQNAAQDEKAPHEGPRKLQKMNENDDITSTGFDPIGKKSAGLDEQQKRLPILSSLKRI